MTSRRQKTQACDATQAGQRLAHAKSYLEVAELGGKQAAGHLRQLINLKDTAHYGFISVTASQLKVSLRRASQLVRFAEEILRR